MFQEQVLPAHSLGLLRQLSPLLAQQGFYLAGGTALALRLGHRISVDLDFFTPGIFDPEALLSFIEERCGEKSIILQQSRASICVFLRETKVELLHYPYPQLESHDLEDGILLSSLPDNSAMKLSAFTGRGSKKDFVDLAALLEITPLETILSSHQKKFPNTEIFTVMKSLSWFQDAEEEPDPQFLKGKTWEQTKEEVLHALETV